MGWKEGEAELTWAGILALAHRGHFCVLCDFDLPSCDIRMALLFRAGVVAAGSSVLLLLFPEVQVVPASGWDERSPAEPQPRILMTILGHSVNYLGVSSVPPSPRRLWVSLLNFAFCQLDRLRGPERLSRFPCGSGAHSDCL